MISRFAPPLSGNEIKDYLRMSHNYNTTMKKLKAVAALCLMILSLNSEAKQFKTISSREGLSNNAILSMHQDNRGHLYLGTMDGLNIWNGNTIEIFSSADGKNIFFGNKIRHIIPGSDEKLYLLTTYGLAVLDIQTRNVAFFENMAFSLRLKKAPQEEVYEKVTNAAEILGITEYLTRKPRALSGGQRQRVAIGRAMVRDSKVFLMDEPLSNLDAKLRTEMRSRISMLHKELQTTFVYVTHDQTEAMTMADRIVVMRSGEIMQFDTPQMLYHHPKNMFVAGFIGSPQMNFIECKITKNSNGYSAIFGDYEIKLPSRMNDYMIIYEGKTIVLGIRPEDLSLCKSNDKENTISMFIDIAEMTGADCLLYGDLCGKKFVANVPSNTNIKSETECYLKINTEKLHLFDKVNERLICD